VPLFGDRWREMKDRLSKPNGVGAATGILKGQRMRTIFYEQNKYRLVDKLYINTHVRI